jgi:hypothetical protein
MSRRRLVVNRTNYELAAPLAEHGAALAELYRRWVAEEQRLTIELGADEPPTFADFVAWIVERGNRHPHRPPGRPEHPGARRNRSRAALARHQRERERQTASA